MSTGRRDFLASAAAALTAAALPPDDAHAEQPAQPKRQDSVVATAHWTVKQTGTDSVKLFLWRKHVVKPSAGRGTILFVHGSSVSSTPVFDLQIPGKPEASTMDWFARLGYDTWCVDCEGYGRSDNRRPIDRAFVRSIFTRDHPGTSDLTVVEAFADAVLALDTSVPTGTYIDMSANLPVIAPDRITVPTLVMRGQWDGIASFQDVDNFFAKLPNPDKQFIVMPGIAHTSTRSKNWALVYHLLEAWFSQPEPAYTG